MSAGRVRVATQSLPGDSNAMVLHVRGEQVFGWLAGQSWPVALVADQPSYAEFLAAAREQESRDRGRFLG